MKDKEKFMELRRQRLSDLLSKKIESSGLNQREFCNSLVAQSANAQEEGAYIDSLTYGALQSWLNPQKGAGLPSIDNFCMLKTALGFTSMDQFLLFLGKGILIPSSVENEITPEQMKLKALNMNKDFKIDLLKALQEDLGIKNK